MLRNLILGILVLAAMLLAVVFAALNPGVVTVDLAFAEFEMQKSLAFILAFGFGALFGMCCALLLLTRLMRDRSRLRRSLKLAESEVSSLRTLPGTDAGQ